MVADAEKWHWQWIVAAVAEDESISLLAPDRAASGKQMSLGEDAAIENLLTWLDDGS